MPRLSDAELSRVDARLRKAIADCLSKESNLLDIDVNERSITHKIAEYLQFEFPRFDVDCEYNRKGLNPKRLVLPEECTFPTNRDNLNGQTVFPDIIIHRRNTTTNLVVIEAKKDSNPDTECDDAKLRAFKEQLKYELCYRLKVYVSDKRRDPRFDLVEYPSRWSRLANRGTPTGS